VVICQICFCLKSNKAKFFYKINRGGDITYHGPGQIVGYPILDLENFFTDIHKYLRFLEESIILTLQEYGLNAVVAREKLGLAGSRYTICPKKYVLGSRSRW
jgi:lipoyl(octanoyl) transferase